MVLIFAVALSLIGCVTVNKETVKDMPSAYLCNLLGPGYMTTPNEQMAIYRELENRNQQCTYMPTEIRVKQDINVKTTSEK